jgi:hypothetical protein
MHGATKLRPALSRLLIAALALVSAASLEAQDYAAKLVTQSGQVSVLRDGVAVALFEGNQVRAREVIVTGTDGYAKFLLNDGSTFEVFASSQVVFRAPGSGITELLNVVIGKIKVFIDHSKGPNFKDVSTPTAVISVRGTVFDVAVEDDAGTTFVTVDEGQVAVRNLTAPGLPVLLNKGESIHVFPGQSLVGHQVDPSSVFRQVLKAAQEAVYRTVYGRPGGPVGTGGGSTGTTGEADKGKPGGTSGTGNTGSTGAPPASAPGAGH